MTNNDVRKLSEYLLHALEQKSATHEYATYTNEALKTEVIETIKKLKGFHDPGLTVFRHYQHAEEKGVNVRHFKAHMLEDDEVYDKFILVLLKEFCILAIALLVALEKLHKKQVFIGSITPEDFFYNKRLKKCEAVDMDANLAKDKKIIIEEQKHGNLVSFQVEFFVIKDNKYLAPELKNSMRVYNLQKKLKNLIYAIEERGINNLEQNKEIQPLLSDFHQRHVRYTNKAEIYSLGYTLNQILSHSLEKLAKFNLPIHAYPASAVDEEIVKEADTLLPEEFDNHGNERIIDLLNEVISYIYDLMKEQSENRDSIPESIAKFRSVLARIKAKAPTGAELEKEEEESEEHDELLELLSEEEYEEHEGHEEHAHASHGDHEHDEHKEHASHEEHGHEGHGDHEEHEHEEHAAHEHHEHEEHEHEEHDKHEAHEHHEHDSHEEHEHEDHDKHEAHEHHEHDAHEEHKHEEHEEHEHEHAHAAHEHEEHEHAHEEHEEHSHHGGDHDGHGSHDEHSEGEGHSHSDSAHEDAQHSAMKRHPGAGH